MNHAKEKVKDAASAAKAKAKITQAKVAEKTEAATARSHDERELAHERGKAKVAAAEAELHQAKLTATARVAKSATSNEIDAVDEAVGKLAAVLDTSGEGEGATLKESALRAATQGAVEAGVGLRGLVLLAASSHDQFEAETDEVVRHGHRERRRWGTASLTSGRSSAIVPLDRPLCFSSLLTAEICMAPFGLGRVHVVGQPLIQSHMGKNQKRKRKNRK
uniref:Uncharacterized protein 259I16.2a n=1 Tax=Hordeum vulgare subsp. vulgare TaxID=112509 RepID=Q8SA53_HORVV|nr:unknown [Hordeum vulgare subsp. vulgare]